MEISTPVLLPGAAATVTLTWQPRWDQVASDADLNVRLWVELRSTDGGVNFRLEATGRLRPALRVNLPRGRLDLGRLAIADLMPTRKESAIEIFSTDQRFKEFALTARTDAPGLVVSAPQPLSAERLRALNAVAGYRLTIGLKPGLPTGQFREVVELTTPLYPRPLEIAVDGWLDSGAVSVSPERIDLGAARLSVSQGYRCPPVKIVLRYEDDRGVMVKDVQPPLFEASARRIRANEWSLELALRKEPDLKSRLTPEQWGEYVAFGFEGGVVVCTTTHSQVGELRIPIGPGRILP